LVFRQLIPETATVEIGQLLSSLDLAPRANAELPYTIVNFISSADGRAAFHGRSGAFGDQADREVFHGLREQVEAVLVGTRTLRMERYGRLVRDPERRARREQAGRSPEPLACVVTRSGDLPTDAPMFAEPAVRVVVFSPMPVDVARCRAQIELVQVDPGELTLTTVLRLLRSDHGIRSLLCEGGPTMFGSLLREGLANELFLTLAPKLVGGGGGPTIASGPEPPELTRLTPVWLLEHDGSLFLRYAVGSPGTAERGRR
jgi:5-amino-6-(5-phosphoribosylamino)uracil reductase